MSTTNAEFYGEMKSLFQMAWGRTRLRSISNYPLLTSEQSAMTKAIPLWNTIIRRFPRRYVYGKQLLEVMV